MYKWQKGFLFLWLSVVICNDNVEASAAKSGKEWAYSLDGLKTDDPQVFVDWAQLYFDVYDSYFYEHAETLDLHFAPGDPLVIVLHSFLGVVFHIKAGLNALHIRNLHDCYSELKERYMTRCGCGFGSYSDIDPLSSANYQAYCQGPDAVANLPRIEAGSLEQLITRTVLLYQKYYEWCFGEKCSPDDLYECCHYEHVYDDKAY